MNIREMIERLKGLDDLDMVVIGDWSFEFRQFPSPCYNEKMVLVLHGEDKE